MKENSLFDASCLSRDVLTPYHSEVEPKRSAFIPEISCQTLKSPKVRLGVGRGWGHAQLQRGCCILPANTVAANKSSYSQEVGM